MRHGQPEHGEREEVVVVGWPCDGGYEAALVYRREAAVDSPAPTPHSPAPTPPGGARASSRSAQPANGGPPRPARPAR